MYNEAVNTFARALVGGFRRGLSRDENDFWSGVSRFAPPTVSLQSLNCNLVPFTDVEIFDVESGSFQDVVICSPPGMRKSLATLHTYLTSAQGSGRELAAFNNANSANNHSGAAPALVVFKGACLVLALWSDARARNGMAFTYERGMPKRAFECQFQTGRFSLCMPALATAPVAEEVTVRFLLSAVSKHQQREELLLSTAFCPLSHHLFGDRDGSVLIRRNRSAKRGVEIDNPHGPAVITSSGHALYFSMGREISEKACKRGMRFRKSVDLVTIHQWARQLSG